MGDEQEHLDDLRILQLHLMTLKTESGADVYLVARSTAGRKIKDSGENRKSDLDERT